jgi:sec-independent protein translocase protein TatC
MVIAIGVFAFDKWVFKHIILAPKEKDFISYQILGFAPPEFDLETRVLGEQFIVSLKVSLLMGLIFSFPFILWEIWRFIKPGLYPNEIKAARGVVLICSFLFALGVLFGYYVISPFAITFLAGYDIGAVSAPTIDSYVNYLSMFTLPTGLIFELPVVAVFLARIGLIDQAFMRTYRKHAFVVFLVFAAIITPPDVITQFLIAAPLYILYEISIRVIGRVEARNAE